jgi:predicted nucleotidyltransferase
MSDPTQVLRRLAERVSSAYLTHAEPCAILLVGSAGRGDADGFSDLDLILYYDDPTSEAALAAARAELRAERFALKTSPDEEGSYGERYYLDGVQCQLGHIPVESFEGEIARLVVELELDEELPKIVTGLIEGLPLYGEDRIVQWRRQAAYTEELQRAMIEKHWRFFPWWYFRERLGARDTTIWRYDVLVQSAYSLVGVLAALNRIYFSTLEFKRSSDFLRRLAVAPPDFEERVHALFELDEDESTAELESLVSETGNLVAERFPDLDLTLSWGGSPTQPGAREVPWDLPT